MKYSLLIAMASLLASGSSIARAAPGKWAPLAVAPTDHVSVADQFSRTRDLERPIETVMVQLNSLGTKYAMGNGVGRNGHGRLGKLRSRLTDWVRDFF